MSTVEDFIGSLGTKKIKLQSSVDPDEEVDVEHHGIKGMHWGIRNKRTPTATPNPNGKVTINRPSRKDRKWQKNVYSLHGAIAVHNHVADQMNNGILDKLNSKPQYKNHRMFDKYDEPNQDKISQAYFREYNQLNIEATKRAYTAVHGVSPSGHFRATMEKNDRGQWVSTIKKVDATHADDPWEDLVIEVDVDNQGYIVSSANIKTSVGHGFDIDDFLDHHGIKGMHWGIRNKKNSSRGRSKKAKADRPTAHDLSDEDLKKAVSRMQMEKQYNTLSGAKTSRGRKTVAVGAAFVGGIAMDIARSQIKSQASSQVEKALVKVAAKKVVKKAVKKGIHGPGY